MDQDREDRTKPAFLTRQRIVALALPLVSIPIFFYYLFSGDAVFIGGWQDILANTMPYHFLANHPFALWNNAWITGFPEIAAPMSDRFYPFSFPVYFLSGDIYAINWVLIGHLLLAYATSYLLFSLVKKEYTIPHFLVPAFSLVYMLSGVILARVSAGHIFIVYALAWIPLLYYAYFEIARYSGKNVRNILIFAIASMFILFSASVYYLFFAYIFLALFFLHDNYHTRDRGAVLALFLAFFIFLLIGSVKIIPDLTVQEWVIRQDVIDPLSNGGSLESNLASFIFGSSITKGYQVSGLVFGFHESIVLIGVIITFFIIMGFLLGKREWAVPGFLAFCFALIWADGGKTLFSFIHLFPILESFRSPGRIFAALLPLLLIIGIQGFTLLLAKLRESGRIVLTDEQKGMVKIGVAVLAGIKLTEVFFQEPVTTEALLSLLFLGLILGVVYLNRASFSNLLILLCAVLVINIAGISWNFAIVTPLAVLQAVATALVLLGAVLALDRDMMKNRVSAILTLILIAGIVVPVAGNASYLSPNYLDLEKSPSREIAATIRSDGAQAEQVWVLTTGRPYNDIVLTYWLLLEGLHPARAYYAYYLADSVNSAYKIGNETFLSSEYVVDTLSLENGNVNIDDVSFTVANVPVYRPDRVLPNVFAIRDGTIYPVSVETFEPDRIIVKGDFIPGDAVILKYSYYPGWKANGENTISAGNMIGYEVKYPLNEVIFSFESTPFSLAVILCIAGLCGAILLVVKRNAIESALAGVPSGNKRKRPLKGRK